MPTKDEAAQRLANARFHLDGGITHIFRILGPDEADPISSIKLLEVNPVTVEVGISPIGSAADPGRDVHHPVVIVEVSDGECDRLVRRQLTLPHGWTVGPELRLSPLPAGVDR